MAYKVHYLRIIDDHDSLPLFTVANRSAALADRVVKKV
jgi:hypothetical protein